jgi:hypothetical protein
VKTRIGSQASAVWLDQFARWMPSKADLFRRIAAKSPLGIEIEIKPVKPLRTLEQNSIYWKIIAALAAYVGMTKAEMHDEVLSELHGFDLVEFRGSIKKRPRGRSSNLSREDFSPLIEIAMRWCAEMGVVWESEAA